MKINEMQSANGWDEWAIWIKKSIEEIKADTNLMNNKIDDLRIAMAVLKTKSGVWGAIGGLIPVLTLIILYLVFH
jgi:hypothetical protein